MLIEVTVFGTYHMRDAHTPRNVALMKVLKEEGGINAKVPPGKYLFNVVLGPTGWVVTLDPA